MGVLLAARTRVMVGPGGVKCEVVAWTRMCLYVLLGRKSRTSPSKMGRGGQAGQRAKTAAVRQGGGEVEVRCGAVEARRGKASDGKRWQSLLPARHHLGAAAAD